MPRYSAGRLVAWLLAMFVLIGASQARAAESLGTELVIRPASGDRVEQSALQPGEPKTARPANFQHAPSAAPIDARAYQNHRLRAGLRQAQFQNQPAVPIEEESLQSRLAKDPCAAMDEKPLASLGINVALPLGQMPDDPASSCWNQLNASAGPFAAVRHWGLQVYNWDATCLCHRPLYFEQINLERHGYGCCEPLQPLASAAHLFATVPALPYCMAVECPCECVYTLGHYRPGSCPPWRHHWPPCSPLAAAAEGGVWTGMIFLIP